MDEAFKEVGAQAHIHARFPVVEAAALEDARNQVVQANLQIKYRVRFEDEAVDRANPLRSAPRTMARAINE